METDCSCAVNSLIRELLNENSEVLKLPTDKALVEDPKFRSYVERYAKVINQTK